MVAFGFALDMEMAQKGKWRKDWRKEFGGLKLSERSPVILELLVGS